MRTPLAILGAVVVTALPLMEAQAMDIRSLAFEAGGSIPSAYTCDGEDRSPALEWNGAPDGTKTFALIADDPDAPGKTWVHWVAWNIPATSRSLPEGMPNEAEAAGGIRQGTNDFGRVGYGGPCPPRGVHRYVFKLYALDAVLDLPPGTSKASLVKAIEGHVLAEAQVMGTYSRSRR